MGKIKIMNGYLGGRNIYISDRKNKGYVRPFETQSRDLIFSFINNKTKSKSILELFAGSGICSFEAISRNALVAYAVDTSISCLRDIHKNRNSLSLRSKLLTINLDSYEVIKKMYYNKYAFDIILVDPPFNMNLSNTFWFFLFSITKKNAKVVYRGRSNFYGRLNKKLFRLSSQKNFFFIDFPNEFISEKWDLNPRL